MVPFTEMRRLRRVSFRGKAGVEHVGLLAKPFFGWLLVNLLLLIGRVESGWQPLCLSKLIRNFISKGKSRGVYKIEGQQPVTPTEKYLIRQFIHKHLERAAPQSDLIPTRNLTPTSCFFKNDLELYHIYIYINWKHIHNMDSKYLMFQHIWNLNKWNLGFPYREHTCLKVRGLRWL